MSRQLIFVFLTISFVSCKRSKLQIITLRNLSSETIYFLISRDSVVTNTNEIAKVRPITSDPFSEIKVEYEDKELAERIGHNLYRYRIERDSVGIILTSESAGIFVNAVRVMEIIRNRYHGQLHIFIITENDLLQHSDQEVIDKKLCKHFKAVTVENIHEDTLSIEYF